MRSLPRKAQLFLITVYVAGIAAAFAARSLYIRSSGGTHWELILLLVGSMLVGSKKVHLMRNKHSEEVGSMSPAFAMAFAAMLRFGPSAGVLVASASSLSSCLYPKRQPTYQLLFNVALSASEALIAGIVFLTLNRGALVLNPIASFPAIAASSLTFFSINTGSVATIIALCTEQNAFQLWRQTFLWTAPSYFAGAGIGALALLLFSNRMTPALLFGSPVAYLIYTSYDVYTKRAEEKQKHIEELQVSQEHLADLYLATIKSLALAIDAKDQYTHQHILRVQRYAVATAKQMGLTGAELEGVNTGALLHDIGKLGVPEYVLLKPGRLTDEEFDKIKKHPEIGAAILDPVEFPWPVLPVVKYHHEKWDGTGYPEGLKGEDIPLTARILAVGDVYDALTSTRSYRNAWTHEKAIGVIKKDAGTHFDPVVVEAFLQVIDGVVQEMAQEGYGPLVVSPKASRPVTTKADEAARDIQRASSELWALYEVAQTLSSSLGLQETLDILARKLEAILPGTGCVFFLKEESGPQLFARAAVGVNREFFQGCSTLNENSRSQQIVQDRETYMGVYDQDDLLLTGSQTTEWVPILSALIVPIVHQGEVLGTINLYHPQQDAFGQHDRQLLEAIAERAAMALYNGLLYDRTRSHALTDPLTGLHNVRYLTQYVEDRCRAATLQQADGAIEEASAESIEQDTFALLCLDLDSFKPINDNFGHQKGDQVLRDLGRMFHRIVQQEDVVTRYGGDEFVIVLNGADPAEAEETARRLQHAVESYDAGLFHPKLGQLRLGASIGIACFPRDGRDCAALLSAADANMYGDKTERKLGQLVDRERTGDRANREEESRFLPRAA